ncbi:MAG TPA: recombinase family protein [Acidiferrobacterales bacterium]
MKVAIYARYSSDLQRQASIADQSRNCERLVERERWEIVVRFKDEALSGAKVDRPGYQVLMAAAKARRETSRLLAERRRGTADTDAARRKLAATEREIENVLAAIRAGVITPTTKGELERLESERDKLLASLSSGARKLEKVGHILPRAVERFRDMVENLEAVTLRDVTRARAQLRRLIGEVPLHPRDGHLEAELTGNYAGVLRLVDVDATTRNNCGTEERT